MDPDAIRRIRGLIPDSDAVFGEYGDETIFTDDAINDFFTQGFLNEKYAAGLAQITIGNSDLLILKIITNYETKTDGATAQKQWLASGNMLIAQGQEELRNGMFGDGVLDYIDTVHGPHFNGGHHHAELSTIPWWLT